MEKETFDVKVNFTLRVTDEDVEDIMVTALEGGIGYWACLDTEREEWKDFDNQDDPVSIYAAKLLMGDGNKVLYFIDVEDDEEVWKLDFEDLLKGIKLTVLNIQGDQMIGDKIEKDIYGLDLNYMDANVADMIIQYALFDEIVFS